MAMPIRHLDANFGPKTSPGALMSSRSGPTLRSSESPPHATRPASASPSDPTPAAIQLERFERSVRDPQRLALILRLLGPLQGAQCLFLGCGAPSGALPFHLRAAGGRWVWAELTSRWTRELGELLAEPINVVLPTRLPFLDGQFHRVVVLDPNLAGSLAAPLSRELGRVLAPHGRMVTVAGNQHPAFSIRLLHERSAARTGELDPKQAVDAPYYRHQLAIRPEEEVPPGLSFRDLEAMAAVAGLIPDTRGACSRFFSEWVEETRRRHGAGAVGPLGRTVAALDHLVPSARGATVAVAARKPALAAAG